MSHERPSIDISHMPELVRLAEEVRLGGAPRVLRHADEDLAVLAPLDDAPTDTASDAEALLARLHRNREARTHAGASAPNTLRLIHRARERRTRHLRSL